MRHRATSLVLFVACVVLLTEAMSQVAYPDDQHSTLMHQSDYYRRRLEKQQSQKELDASKAGSLEESNSRIDYLLVAIFIFPLIILLLYSGRISKRAKIKQLGKSP